MGSSKENIISNLQVAPRYSCNLMALINYLKSITKIVTAGNRQESSTRFVCLIHQVRTIFQDKSRLSHLAPAASISPSTKKKERVILTRNKKNTWFFFDKTNYVCLGVAEQFFEKGVFDIICNNARSRYGSSICEALVSFCRKESMCRLLRPSRKCTNVAHPFALRFFLRLLTYIYRSCCGHFVASKHSRKTVSLWKQVNHSTPSKFMEKERFRSMGRTQWSIARSSCFRVLPHGSRTLFTRLGHSTFGAYTYLRH